MGGKHFIKERGKRPGGEKTLLFFNFFENQELFFFRFFLTPSKVLKILKIKEIGFRNGFGAFYIEKGGGKKPFWWGLFGASLCPTYFGIKPVTPKKTLRGVDFF